MYRQWTSPLVWILCLLATLLRVEAAAATPAPGTNAAAASKTALKVGPEELKFTGSVFFDNINDTAKFGTDIFFPTTKRFLKKLESTNSASPVKSETPALSQFVLKGISGNGTRRLAVINNRTVGQGEILEIKHNGQSYRVKCEQINSALTIKPF